MLKVGFLGARSVITWRDTAVDNTVKTSRHIIYTLRSSRLHMCPAQRSAKIIVKGAQRINIKQGVIISGVARFF